MKLQRLLERIGNEGEDPLRGGADEKTVLLKSICSHLNRVLNTREGSTLIAPDYGLPHFSSMSSRFSTDMAGTVADIESSIRNTIAEFEPRLTGVRAKMLDKADYDISMTLDLEAMIETDEGKERVPLRVVITSSGKIEVSS